MLTPNNPILTASQDMNTAARYTHVLRRTAKGRPALVINEVVGFYVAYCLYFEVDLRIALAQMVHETDYLNSFWSQPPRWNFAGIGVTGQPGKGVVFNSMQDGVLAHVGRLFCYAAPLHRQIGARQRIVDHVLSWRPLPDETRGNAPLLGDLVGPKRWAVDPGYVEKICRVANEIAKVDPFRAGLPI